MASSKKQAGTAAAIAPDSAWQGAFAAYGTAFKRIKANPEPAVFFVAAYAVLAILSGLFQGGKSYMDDTYSSFEDLLYFVFLLAMFVYGLALADGKKITIQQFMRFSFNKYISVLVAVILYVLIVAGSLLLLIIPAIWTIAWFYFQGYAVVDKGVGPIAALKASKQLAKNHKGKVWGLIGVGILIAIPASVVAYVPYIGSAATAFATIWAAGAGAILYRWLQKDSTHPLPKGE